MEGSSHISDNELNAFDFEPWETDPDGGGDHLDEDEISFRLNSR